MIKKSYEQFEALVTRFRHKARTDPFFVAGLKIMGLYFLVGSAIFVIFGWILGYFAREPLYRIAPIENGAPVTQAIALLEQELLVERLLMLMIFGIAAYFLTDFVLRPIKKSAELQRRFVAIVSHELRTPVTIMKNASEIGLRHESTITREKAISIIKSNLEETNRLSETMQFLLTFTELRNRQHSSDLVPQSLSVIVEKNLQLMEKIGAEYNVKISVDVPDQAMIRGSQTALEGMLINLVKNAARHSSSGATVFVAIESGSTHVRLSVSDSGTGIEKKDLPYIFEPFYRGKNESRRIETRKGAGLGLSIVKEVAELHHATVSVSTNKNTGSVFTLSFPLYASYPQIQNI